MSFLDDPQCTKCPLTMNYCKKCRIHRIVKNPKTTILNKATVLKIFANHIRMPPYWLEKFVCCDCVQLCEPVREMRKAGQLKGFLEPVGG